MIHVANEIFPFLCVCMEFCISETLRKLSVEAALQPFTLETRAVTVLLFSEKTLLSLLLCISFKVVFGLKVCVLFWSCSILTSVTSDFV